MQVPKGLAVAGLGRVHSVMHNTEVVSLLSFGEKEGSRGRQSWAERREGNREAWLGVLQETPGKAKESQRRSPSEAQEIQLESSVENNERSL
jgi:hypothetical protein